jgi:hypothetical protein
LALARLRTCFPRIHGICEDTNMSIVEDVVLDWQIRLRGRMRPEEWCEWNELQGLMNSVSISSDDDEIVWGLSPSKSFTTNSKSFTTNSLYKFLTS